MDIFFRNARVVLPHTIAAKHCVLVRGDRIVWVGPADACPEAADAQVVDVEGRLLGPGFIDLHCHGGGGAWFHEDAATAAQYHLQHGSTSLQPTTILHATSEEQIAAVAAVGKAITDGLIPNAVGIHMEGPYMHPDLGAYREYSRPATPEEYLEFVDAGQGYLQWMTIAPEVDGVAEMVTKLQLATDGRMTFSVGHSKAAPEQIRRLMPSGLRMATHLTNATGCAHEPSRFAGTREVGMDEITLLEPGIVAEVIADRGGRHVRSEWLRLIFQIKGVDGVVLVTDATAERGEPIDGVVSDVNYTVSGGLAGSSLTMDVAVGNFVRHTGASLVDAWRVASLTPARCLGRGDLGVIQPGALADLVIADHDLETGLLVHEVWLRGNQCEEKKHG